MVSSHQVRVDSLEPGWTTREMISARARSRCAAGRAKQRGQAQGARHGVRGGDVAVRQRPGDGDRVAGGDQLLAFQPGVDQVDDVAGQGGQVGHGLVLDLAAVAVGAAQVGRGVVLAAALLVDVSGLA